MYFQANIREVDLDLTREQYMHTIYRQNDFLFNIGSYDFIIASAIPEKTLDFATMLRPYDVYIWIFIIISVLAVTATMMVIEKTSCTWLGDSSTSSIHQCISKK